METKAFIAQKIRELRKKQDNMSGEKLGSLLSPPISGKTISSWERARTKPTTIALAQLGKIFDVPVSTFYPPTPSHEGDFALDVAYVDVPLLGSAPAGKPFAVIPVDDTHPIPLEVYQKYPQAFFLRVEGESMNNVLPHGSFALIDPAQNEPRDEAVYAFCVNDEEATIKRIRKDAHGFTMLPDSKNADFKPTSYDLRKETSDDITIIGRVVWMMPPFDWTL